MEKLFYKGDEIHFLYSSKIHMNFYSLNKLETVEWKY